MSAAVQRLSPRSTATTHPRLANTSRARQKARVKDGRTTKSESSFGKKLWCVLIILFLGGIGWQMWKLNAYNNAVREAKEAGFNWKCDDTLSLIRQDWHNALKKETWGTHPRVLVMEEVPDLGRYREMLHRLRPTVLSVRYCNDESVSVLKGLTGLQTLGLYACPALKNMDGLKGLTGLRVLDLRYCPALQNVDDLKGLTGLQELRLDNCPGLQNVDVLKGLTGLQDLDLINCTALKMKSVDVLKSLTGLQKLNLYDCTVLQNVDGLKSLTGLQSLKLGGCPALQNANVLKGLTGLQTLDLTTCPELQNVDGLKGLTGLQELWLRGCDKIPDAALRELRAALPNTFITFPDGTMNPPQ